MTSQYLEYPIDSKKLLRKKLQIRDELLHSDTPFIDKRIAVLGGSTTSEIIDQLELFLLSYGIRPTFYESEYGQYWQDAVFGNDKLDAFKPDMIYIHTSWRNIASFAGMDSSQEEVDSLLKEEYDRFEQMWIKISERC